MIPAMWKPILIAILCSDLALGSDAGQRRDLVARATFVKKNPCPSTGKPRGACPGWVVDHVIAIACGGADLPVNMQWQTVEDAKAKDRWERKGCKRAG